MKIQIDTTEKTIRIEEEITLKELSEFLYSLFKDTSWMEYKLIPKIKEDLWNNPIIITIKEQPNPVIFPYPSTTPNTNPYWQQPIMTYQTALSGTLNNSTGSATTTGISTSNTTNSYTNFICNFEPEK